MKNSPPKNKYKRYKKEGLFLLPGGQLILSYWDYDDKIKAGSYKSRDVTTSAVRYLYDNFEIDREGISLRDIFSLVQKNPELITMFTHRWIREYLDEVSLITKKTPNSYSKDGIEFLEVYRFWEIDKDGGNLSISRPDFHGIGWALREEIKSNNGLDYPAGARINWGISPSALPDIIDIPIKLSKKITLFNENTKKNTNFKSNSFKLGEVLDAIFYELSWYGGPKEKKTFNEKTLNVSQSLSAKNKKI